MTEQYIIAWLITFILGCGFSAGIQLLHIAGYLCDHEYKWVEVGLGVVVSLIASPIFLPWEVLAQVVGLFVATGIPMVAGCIIRAICQHRRNNAALAEKKRRKMDKVEGKLDGETD